MTDATYIVFQDGLSGFKWIARLGGDNLKEVVQSITEDGRLSQNFVYYIYKKHEQNVPIVGTRFDTFRYVKAVAGIYAESRPVSAHDYAITNRSSMAWFFSDNLFE